VYHPPLSFSVHHPPSLELSSRATDESKLCFVVVVLCTPAPASIRERVTMLRRAISPAVPASPATPSPACVRRRAAARRLRPRASANADNDAAEDGGSTAPPPTTTPHFARLVEAPPSGAPGPAGSQPRSAAVPLPSTPPELEGLTLDAKTGDLIDTRTGKPLPGLGEPTRFDIKVAALRGDLDPPAWRPNTERAPAALVGALLGPWPLDYPLNVVGRPAAGQSPEAFANEIAALVHKAGGCPGPVPTVMAGKGGGEGDGEHQQPLQHVTFKKRSLKVRQGGGGGGNEYVSVCVTARMRSADLLEEAFDALAKDPRVVMRY